MQFFDKKTQGASPSNASFTSNDTSLRRLDARSEKETDDVTEISMANTSSRGSSAHSKTVGQKIDDVEEDHTLEQQDSQEYPQGIKLVLITIALAASIFCLAVDNTIISTAIPRITDE